MTANDVSARLKSAKRVAIFGHMHPDLDSFGAMLGAKFLCESLGVKCDVFAEFMKNLSFLRISLKLTLNMTSTKENMTLCLLSTATK